MFDFEPQFVFYLGWLSSGTYSSVDYNARDAVCIPALKDATKNKWAFGLGDTRNPASYENNTLSWYSTSNATQQINEEGYTYYFAAIG